MTATITRRAELAHRTGDGIDDYLFWEEPTNGATLNVLDARTHDSFDRDVDRRGAGSNSPGTAINSWRNDHARTDR